MVMTWACLESLDPELGDCFRMTVDIVTDFQKAGPSTNLKKRRESVGFIGKINITSLVDLLWVTSFSSYTCICSVCEHMNK